MLSRAKNSQQNEIQSAYFGNSTFSIFTACCYTESLEDGGLQKDPTVVVSESEEHNRAATLTSLNKVIEKPEEVNVAKYNKIIVWSDGCSVQFRSCFVLRLLAEIFLMVLSSRGTITEKAMERVPWTMLEGPWKTSSASQIGLCYDWFTLRFPSSHTQICSIDSVYLRDTDVMKTSRTSNRNPKRSQKPSKYTVRKVLKWKGYMA